MRTLILPVILVACEPTPTRKTLTDEGTVCLNDAGEVEVTFPVCLSSSCDTLISATCRAALEADQVVVHAEAVIQSEGEECTADCGIVIATCAMPPVEDPALLTFSYAETETPLDAACQGF